MTIFFTSDQHYGHKRIIEYAHRPFPDVQTMNEQMILRYNTVVKPEDTTYHLGDFAFLDWEAATKIFQRLNGNKVWVFGNHDRKLRLEPRFVKQWGWARDLTEIKVDGQSITLCHYAMKVWNKSHHGAWQLYGHSHGSMPDDPKTLSLDVGVDCWDFTPVSYSQVAERMKAKTYVPVDGHGRE